MDQTVERKSFLFAVRIVKLSNHLNTTKKEYVLSKQLLRCGTSIGANIAEAVYGSSRNDFVFKLQIARKEAAETIYWLELLFSGAYLTEQQYTSLKSDCVELIAMLSSSIKSCEK